MTQPCYYRGLPPWGRIALGAGVLTAVVFAARHLLATHDARVRARVYDEAHAGATATLTVQRAHWQQQRDSLTAITRQHDTVLVTSIRRVRELVHRTDTVTVSRDTLVHACTALADDCAAFRVSATTALLAADSLHALDAARVTQIALQRVASSDSVRSLAAQRDQRPTRARALFGTLAFSGLAYLVGRLTP